MFRGEKENSLSLSLCCAGNRLPSFLPGGEEECQELSSSRWLSGGGARDREEEEKVPFGRDNWKSSLSLLIAVNGSLLCEDVTEPRLKKEKKTKINSSFFKRAWLWLCLVKLRKIWVKWQFFLRNRVRRNRKWFFPLTEAAALTPLSVGWGRRRRRAFSGTVTPLRNRRQAKGEWGVGRGERRGRSNKKKWDDTLAYQDDQSGRATGAPPPKVCPFFCFYIPT